MAAPAPRNRPENGHADLEKELKGTLMHTLSDISSLPFEQSSDRAQALSLDVLPATHATSASFGRAWNDIQHDPIAALPAELRSACFSWLDLNSRISISHVSRTWRNTALSDRTLWTEYTVSGSSHLDVDGGLRAMLSRSDPLRFQLTCQADISESLVDYIGLHLHRIQVLRLEVAQLNAVLRLMEREAPLLEKFLYRHSDYPSDSPFTHLWSTSQAPRLQKVTLGTFLLPSGSVFAAIRVFEGTIPAGGTLPGPLASIFPELVHLVLNDVTQRSLGALETLPFFLRTVVLNSSDEGPLDYSEFLRACHAVDLSYLYINRADSPSDAVDLVLRKPDHPWNLALAQATSLTLGTAEGDYEIDCHSRISLVHEPAIMAHLNRLAHLTLSLLEYASFYQSRSWKRALPALTQCTIHTDSPGSLEWADDLLAASPIKAPALKSIHIRITERGAYVTGCAKVAYTAPIARSLAVPCLDELILCLHRQETLVPADLTCLTGLARRVSVRDFHGTETTIVVETRG